MPLSRAKALLHLAGRRRRVLDADDIYYLEAESLLALGASRRDLARAISSTSLPKAS